MNKKTIKAQTTLMINALKNKGFEIEKIDLKIEGQLPAELRGTLYRNGPGLFERNNIKNHSILDGDGFMQSFKVSEGKISYQARFVATPKYIEESKIKQFIHPTWSKSLHSINPIKNATIPTQAGVSFINFAGHLYACDDNGVPLKINPSDLSVCGSLISKTGEEIEAFAHSKVDLKANHLITYSLSYGPNPKINLIIMDDEHSVLLKKSVALPNNTYFHDFFVTDNYIIFILHPIELKLWPFLWGKKSFIDSLVFSPSKVNVVKIIDRKNGEEVNNFDLPPSFMWHAVNAWEENQKIVLYFLGYKEPNHFIGENPHMRMAMDGLLGEDCHNGNLRKYTLHLAKNNAVEEIINMENMDFPVINSHLLGTSTRYFYALKAHSGSILFYGLVKYDLQNNTYEQFLAPEGCLLGEPLLVGQDWNTEMGGYILMLMSDANALRSYLLCFDAENIKNGPLAKIHLPSIQPLGFHGIFIEEKK